MPKSTLMSGWALLTGATLCHALPPPEPELDEAEARRMLECAIAMRPAQPNFPDPVATDSPNAVGRYAAIYPTLDDRSRKSGGSVALSASKFEVTDPDLYGITTDDYRQLLEAFQATCAQLMAASKVDRFVTHEVIQPSYQPLRSGDPRRDLNSCMRKAARLLRDDAVRCWVSGQRDDAIARVCAIIRMGGQRARGDIWTIDALVADSLVQLGVAAATCFLDDAEHPLPPASREALLEAIQTLDPDDPGGLYRTWRRSYEVNARFVNDELRDGQIGQDLQLELGSLHGGLAVVRAFTGTLLGKKSEFSRATTVDDAVKKAVDQTIDGAPEWSRSVSRWSILRRHADQGAQLFAEADALWKNPDAADLLKPIDQKMDADLAGVLLLTVGVPRQTQKTWRRGVDSVVALRERLLAVK